MNRRLEELLFHDSIGSGSAFYGHIGDFDEKGVTVQEKDKLKTVLYRDGKVFTVNANLIHVPYEVNNFTKLSEIDKIIYKMLKVASLKEFGKIQKLHKKKDKYYIGEFEVNDLLLRFTESCKGGDGINSCRLVSDSSRYLFLSQHIKYENSFQSEVLPLNRAILCGPPGCLGLINKAYKMDDWGQCNFAVYVGNVIVFDTSKE